MNENSFSKNEISNDSEIIKLPLIDFKLIPQQKSISFLKFIIYLLIIII